MNVLIILLKVKIENAGMTCKKL